MIDIHAHIVPGVDDGPATWDEALAIVRAAARDGVTAIVATSHMWPDGPYANEADTLLPLVDELQRRIGAAGLNVTVYPGGELRLTPDVVDRIRSGRALTYCNARRYALLEMPSDDIPLYAREVLFALQLEGITPILAHPERNKAVIRDPRRLRDLVARGALVQMTAESPALRGPVGETSRLLLRHGLVHFLASDAHDTVRRPPGLRRHVERYDGRLSADDVDRLVRTNAERVIRGEAISVPPSARRGGRRAQRHRSSDKPAGLLKSAVHFGQALLSR